MDKKQTDSLMNASIRFSSIVIILGAFLKISHYSYGNLVLTIGFLSVSVLSSFEISRLKKIIKQSEVDKTDEK
jgi:hypothetical protein